ncbi:hypothetical protein GYMLUDRAFT_46094 [Collybiopsis luxurians FD-317 M1]|uniref:NmrA-like domain-containing protein n=1 Tax=Collybiopsis luxurians FD-317 M1 TaxID=944289 RepID=A0A0D0C540_9AGAR|nr:hypothetical protein GYMLUDRAFT_46094 [Collybiopsis luxurians FD-317 M1]
MSSTISKNVALIGVGRIGTRILRALLATNQANVTVLTRSAKVNDAAHHHFFHFHPHEQPHPHKSLPSDLSSVPIVEADYNATALAAILKEHNIEIVISTVNASGLKAQYVFADAAKLSGCVKLFVPSEWGVPTEGAQYLGEDNIFGQKDAFAEYLKKIELPYTRFYTGIFIDSLPWLVGAETNHAVNVLGKGETFFSVTSEEDIGGFVAHVITAFPSSSSRLKNQSLRIQGDRITMRSLSRIYRKPLEFIPEGDEVPAKTPEEATLKTFLQIEADCGMASTGWDRRTETERGDAGSANKLWEGHVWQTVEDFAEAHRHL